MSTLITSLQNNRIKEVIKLAKHNERERRRVTVVEGSAFRDPDSQAGDIGVDGRDWLPGSGRHAAVHAG